MSGRITAKRVAAVHKLLSAAEVRIIGRGRPLLKKLRDLVRVMRSRFARRYWRRILQGLSVLRGGNKDEQKASRAEN